MTAEIVQRQPAHIDRADPAYGDGVREALARLGVATPARPVRG